MARHRFRWDHHQGDVLSFALVFTVPLSVLIGYALGGWGLALTPLLVFGVVPLLDGIIGTDTTNPAADGSGRQTPLRSYRTLT